jgi:hypothetical protein
MSRQCRCCGGRCGEPVPVELNRRDFLGKLAAGTATVALVDTLAWAGDTLQPPPLAPPKAAGPGPYPLAPSRVFRGKHLEAVGMPLGGIGTGSIWLDGQGRLAVWQIFNNLSEPRIPDSFFAVSARTGSGRAVTRVLQTQPEGTLHPVESLDYEGGYPIARLTFHDPALPVRVSLEAMNPMIPLDAANSSIPCALFRLTVHNPGTVAAEVAVLATLQNAVGSGGSADVRGVRLGGYGGNRNREIRHDGLVAVAMDQSPDPVASGPVRLREADGREAPGPEMFWLAGLAALIGPAAEPLGRIAADGGVLLADGARPDFFDNVARLRTAHGGFASVATVFEDFEKKTYEGWTITGSAFGQGPSHGTESGQQPVTGFVGRGLVNTYVGGDPPQGTATSASSSAAATTRARPASTCGLPARWSARQPARTARPWNRPPGTSPT